MNSNDVLVELKDIYKDVSEWLKFAEGKSIAAISIITILSAWLTTVNFSKSLVWYCLITEVLILGIVALVPFIPYIHIPFIEKCVLQYAKNNCKNQNCNIVFYLSVHCLNAQNQYESAVLNVFNITVLSEIQLNYISQIVAVSRLATRKYYLFSVFIKMTFFFVFIDLLAVIIA